MHDVINGINDVINDINDVIINEHEGAASAKPRQRSPPPRDGTSVILSCAVHCCAVGGYRWS